MADISDLLNAGLIDDDLARRGREAVEFLFDDDTVFASISPIDDGDLSFYWIAGKRSVSIQIIGEPEPGYEGIWYAVWDGTGHRAIGTVSGPTDWLRTAIADFSAAVEAVNPRWRELYRRWWDETA